MVWTTKSPPRRPQACWRSRLILAWVAPGCRIPFQKALARAETPSRAQLLRSPLCRTGVRGHPRPGSPKPHEGQPPKAVKGLVLPLHPPSWRCWGARTSLPPPDGAELGHPEVKAGKASRGLLDGPLILASRKASPLLAPLDRNQPGSQAQAAWAAASPRLRGESSSMLWELFLARVNPHVPGGEGGGAGSAETPILPHAFCPGLSKGQEGEGRRKTHSQDEPFPHPEQGPRLFPHAQQPPLEGPPLPRSLPQPRFPSGIPSYLDLRGAEESR